MTQSNCVTSYYKISMKFKHIFNVKKCSVDVQHTAAGEKTLLVNGVALRLEGLGTETA